jgi:ribosomal protein S18 acetylase RimI-like enzyme
MNSFRWMSKYLKSQNITDIDVSLSFTEDLEKRSIGEEFLIAYVYDNPAGIIRFEEYWISKALKILSHFPLVVPKYHRKGIGTALVKEVIALAKKEGYKNIWAECWSKEKREIALYKKFYEKNDFEFKSNRLEMSCNLEDWKLSSNDEMIELEIESHYELNNNFITALSNSYAKSEDRLHIIEKLGNKKICRDFLEKTKLIFEKTGFKIKFLTAKYKGEICAALMIASSSIKGIVLEIGVIPKFRKKGIAKQMITNFLNQMKRIKAKEVILGVDLDNKPAINLYEKLGFKKTWFGIMLLLESLD